MQKGQKVLIHTTGIIKKIFDDNRFNYNVVSDDLDTYHFKATELVDAENKKIGDEVEIKINAIYKHTVDGYHVLRSIDEPSNIFAKSNAVKIPNQYEF